MWSFDLPRSNIIIRAGRSQLMFILDTNVVSELRKARAGRADANVVAWTSSTEPSTLYISVITVMELELGVLQAERRDAAQGASLRRWLHAKVLGGV